MAILLTTFNGTHINKTEAEVIFRTTVLADVSKSIAVHIEIIRDGQPANHSDSVLSPQQLVDKVNITGELGIALSGQLTLDIKSRAVVFEGTLNYQDHVRLGMNPVIVAVL